MDTFSCQRCGYESFRKTDFLRHLSRKYPCRPKLQDVSVEELLRNYFGQNVTFKKLFISPKSFLSFSRELREGGEIHHFDTQLIFQKKTLIWASVSALPVKDKRQKVLCYDLIIIDITERKNFERELKESKDMFQALFENTATAIIVTDVSDVLVAWNKFAEKILMMNKTALFNKPIKELFSEKEWKKFAKYCIIV